MPLGVAIVGGMQRSAVNRLIAPVSSTLSYNGSNQLQTVTTASGTKTFTYNVNGVLQSIAGTGAYVNKAFGYTGDNLTSITVS